MMDIRKIVKNLKTELKVRHRMPGEIQIARPGNYDIIWHTINTAGSDAMWCTRDYRYYVAIDGNILDFSQKIDKYAEIMMIIKSELIESGDRYPRLRVTG